MAVMCNLGDRECTFAVSQGSRVVILSQSAIQISQSKLVGPPDSAAVVNECPSKSA